MTIMASLSFSYIKNEQNTPGRCGSIMTYNVGDDARKQHRLLMLVGTFLRRYQHPGPFKTYKYQYIEKKPHTMAE